MRKDFGFIFSIRLKFIRKDFGFLETLGLLNQIGLGFGLWSIN